MAIKNNGNVYLSVKDHSVSGETFELVENSEYGFLETHPLPPNDKLESYYQSEDYISHTDTKRNLFEKLYHIVRRISLKRKIKIINCAMPGAKVLLDIGCGTGDFLKAAKHSGYDVYGIEPNDKARQIANKKTNNVVFDTTQINKFKGDTFDVITLWHVLEHLPNLHEQIVNFKKLLKPEGTLILAVPNFKSYDASHYKSYWAAFDVPRHLWHFSRTSIGKLFSKENMFVAKTIPMWFDAFYVSLLSEKYKSGRMNFIKAIYVGCLSNFKALKSKEASSIIYIVKKGKK